MKIQIKKKKYICLVLSLMIIFLSACAITGGEPIVVNVGGVDIIPGQTTMQDVEDAGLAFTNMGNQIGASVFDQKISAFIDLSGMAEAMTNYTGVYLVKDGEVVASVSVYNASEKEIPYGECLISTVSVYVDHYEHEKASVDGISFEELSQEKFTEVFGKSDSKIMETIYWEKGKYKAFLGYTEDGELEKFGAQYNIY
ncbi:MAG: hypothetical protein IJP31_00055 [Lachnospiraceae bacterium]|nr:hypothetical protein [Lachnospiraceae bacterium]